MKLKKILRLQKDRIRKVLIIEIDKIQSKQQLCKLKQIKNDKKINNQIKILKKNQMLK